LWIIDEYVEKQYQTELSVIVVARIDGFILRAIFLESGDFLVSEWIETTRSTSMERRTVVAPHVGVWIETITTCANSVAPVVAPV
jgi:hypothetical protein